VLNKAPRHEDVWKDGRFHAPATLPPGKEPTRYPWMNPRADLDAVVKRQSSFSGHSRNLLAMPTVRSDVSWRETGLIRGGGDSETEGDFLKLLKDLLNTFKG